MDESKDHEAEKAVSTKSTVDVLAVEISPNPAALSDKLMLKVDFHLETPVANGVWDIEYVVDCVMKHPIIHILSNS
uniref:Uncharacterized protein n=1 Tax=Peronospora matthiolae TaxID=2874970 RepID=A0AAV1UHR3_9STRA